ncbi:single-stranded DNA-binding protein [Streptomyces sp. ASQP_92]|uniref:single-stranded DNA-binding protein n=1 Tax=Streptomyces sp. ASQP_92 TaxID=2979116 RepID=UPI0021BED673|nr:single-stranded DNA-binding protein [Streptomyces sp. ASQP_92]MCT9093458.1 single-stranded DNA-binding protein [Streptomyces sp. ASQP_92]
MPSELVMPISGTVTGDVECRITETGTVIARFRLTAHPREWDPRAKAWRDSKPVSYVCTVWRDLARNAAESLTDGVTVLVHGRVTDVRDNTLWLSVNDLGISLSQRIAYTEQSLPGPQAAAPVSAPKPAAPAAATTASQPAARASARPTPTDSRPPWWTAERTQGWPAFTPAHADQRG